jgi:hypothetical protein
LRSQRKGADQSDHIGLIKQVDCVVVCRINY